MDSELTMILVKDEIYTNIEEIQRLFGDVVTDIENVTPQQFTQLKERCERNEWTNWLEFWQSKVKQ